MKRLLTLFLLLVSALNFAQSVNDYKYVIVPSKFSFTKGENQYNLSALTKGLLQKYGFVAYIDTEEMPDEVLNSNCSRLNADIISSGNFITTKMQVVLKDCKNKTIFTSVEGKSKEKEYNAAYNLALREAFKSFDALGYKYNGSVTSIQREIVKTTNDGTAIKKEIVAVNNPASVTVPGKETLFAQPIENGFQLVDHTPKVVYRIYNTSAKDVFMAEKEQLKGTLVNNNGTWTFDYYSNGKLVSETLNIKF